MPNHQDRRDPLPADYQYPTHGVDCDCPPCRMRVHTLPNGDKWQVWRPDFEVRIQPLEPTAETPWAV